MNDESMLSKAYELFDKANAKDPNLITINGNERPKELVFAERLTAAVISLKPNASEALLLASRCQHICRWKIPRDTQPMGRAGYLKWRAGLKKFHAETSANILNEIGYATETIARVESLNQKKDLKNDPECQTIEDALCLVFLEHQFDALIANTEEEKMLSIVKKTWGKMSKQGQDKALALDFSPQAQEIISKALT